MIFLTMLDRNEGIAMQDRYAGDIGDYGKFALLRVLEDAGLRVGVNWYKTDTAPGEKGSDGKYGIPIKYSSCDPELFEKLREIHGKDGSIAKLQQAGLLRGGKHFNETTPPKSGRGVWQSRALEALRGCDLVFLDPDNGLSAESVRPGSSRSAKYVYLDEIADYIAGGSSVAFYSHRQRRRADEYFSSFRQRFAAEKNISGKPVFALTFPKCSVRDYFLIAASDEHRQKIERAVCTLLAGPFGQKGICKFRAGFSDIGIPACPFCGCGALLKIVYGMPTCEEEQAEERGELLLGGCCVTGSDPRRELKSGSVGKSLLV